MLITQLNKTGMQVKTIQKLLDHILLYAQLLLTEMVDFKKKRVKNEQVSLSRKLHDNHPYGITGHSMCLSSCFEVDVMLTELCH